MCVISYVSLPQTLSHFIFKNSFLTRLITKFVIANYIKPNFWHASELHKRLGTHSTHYSHLQIKRERIELTTWACLITIRLLLAFHGLRECFLVGRPRRQSSHSSSLQINCNRTYLTSAPTQPLLLSLLVFHGRPKTLNSTRTIIDQITITSPDLYRNYLSEII